MQEKEEKPKKTYDEKRIVREKKSEKQKLNKLKNRVVFYHIDAVMLKMIMRMSCMTQDQISKKTGIHYNFISAFVTGKMNPSRDELMTLRRVLGFTLTKVNAKKIEVLV